MTQTKIILAMCIFSLFCSCEKVKEKDSTIQIYKFKSGMDYSDYVPVELSNDKTKITSNPSEVNSRWPIKLVSGYYLNGSMGVNSGYLSLTIEEYNSFDILPGVDSLYKLLVEKDPYLEYFHRNDDGTFRDENGAYGIDTSFINDLIRNGKLGEYFDKLK